MKKYLVFVSLFLVCAVGGFFTAHTLKGTNNEVQNEDGTDEVLTSSQNKGQSQVSPVKVPISKPQNIKPTLVCEGPVLEGESYSLTVKLENYEGKVRFDLLNEGDGKVIASNNDGLFKKIPGSASGTYKLEAYNVDTNEVITSQMIYGFAEIEFKRMTKAEFQTLVNKRSRSIVGGNAKVSRSLSIRVTGLAEGEPPMQNPNLSNIYSQLDYEVWARVNVISVSYDSNGKINAATISPVYP